MLYEKWNNEERTTGTVKQIFVEDDVITVETIEVEEDKPGDPRRLPTTEVYDGTLDDLEATLKGAGFKKQRPIPESEVQ